MAKNIAPGNLKKWAEGEITSFLEAGYNRFINFAVSSFPAESPVYTGFYASSWQASLKIPKPTETYQALKGSPKAIEPWYSIGLSLRSGGIASKPPVVRPRHSIPTFKLKDTVYIANTAEYSIYAVKRPPTVRSKYGGIRPFISLLPSKAPEFFGGKFKVSVMNTGRSGV